MVAGFLHKQAVFQCQMPDVAEGCTRARPDLVSHATVKGLMQPVYECMSKDSMSKHAQGSDIQAVECYLAVVPIGHT